MMELQFPKTIDALESIFDSISRFAESHAVNPDITRLMHFAAEEIFTNMVRYNPESSHDISMGLSLEAGSFTLWLADHDVHSFDPTQRPPVDIDQPLSERTPGGLGIHLVREMMDDVRYEYHDRTSKITVTKRLES